MGYIICNCVLSAFLPSWIHSNLKINISLLTMNFKDFRHGIAGCLRLRISGNCNQDICRSSMHLRAWGLAGLVRFFSMMVHSRGSWQETSVPAHVNLFKRTAWVSSQYGSQLSPDQLVWDRLQRKLSFAIQSQVIHRHFCYILFIRSKSLYILYIEASLSI